MPERQNSYGELLRETREKQGLSRDQLADLVDLDASHIYRIETGDRRPSRAAVLALGEALRVDDESLNRWLLAVGYAPLSALSSVRAAVRSRGGLRPPAEAGAKPSNWEAGLWIRRLESIGLHEQGIERLLRAMGTSDLQSRQRATHVIASAFSRVSDVLESPVCAAVIPAAGGHHRLLATHVMQRLLLGAIAEATASGIDRIILILSPGSVESLYNPIRAAVELAVVPHIRLHYCLQAQSEGLGDAVLQAASELQNMPFAVLLPDDIIHDRGRTSQRQLRRMIDAFRKLDDAQFLATVSVPKSRMASCGVAKLGVRAILPYVYAVEELVEKPPLDAPICAAKRAAGIVGRYILQPGILKTLGELRKQKQRPLELTTALENMRREGSSVVAFELSGKRHDLGEAVNRADELLGS